MAVNLRGPVGKLFTVRLENLVELVARKIRILLQVKRADRSRHRRGEGRAAIRARRTRGTRVKRHVAAERRKVLRPVVVEPGRRAVSLDPRDVDHAVNVLRKRKRLIRRIAAGRHKNKSLREHRADLLSRPRELLLRVVERCVSAAEVDDAAAVREAPPDAVDVVDKVPSIVSIERALWRDAELVGLDDRGDAKSV